MLAACSDWGMSCWATVGGTTLTMMNEFAAAPVVSVAVTPVVVAVAVVPPLVPVTATLGALMPARTTLARSDATPILLWPSLTDTVTLKLPSRL